MNRRPTHSSQHNGLRQWAGVQAKGCASTHRNVAFAANYGESVEEGSISFALTQPRSRGYLRRRSRKPEVQPFIEFRMFSDECDCIPAREGFALTLARSSCLSKVCTNTFAPALTTELPGDDRVPDD